MAAEFYAILSVAAGILVPLAQNLDICATPGRQTIVVYLVKLK
jgi:hypothetical protein